MYVCNTNQIGATINNQSNRRLLSPVQTVKAGVHLNLSEI